MKKLIFLIAFVVVPTFLISQPVTFDVQTQKLIISEVYLQDHPDLCYHVELILEKDDFLPYGIGLSIDINRTYKIETICDTSENIPYFNGVTLNLIIPEFNLNGNIYIINLKFNTQVKKFQIQEIKSKSSVNFGNEKLIGYCGYEINGPTSGCIEYYYIEGNVKEEDVVNKVIQICNNMNSTLINDYCPIYQDFSFACKLKIQDSLSQITYYKESDNSFYSYIDSLKQACESGGGEFIYH